MENLLIAEEPKPTIALIIKELRDEIKTKDARILYLENLIKEYSAKMLNQLK